ncbi:MAG: hypothetical protein KDB53_18595, partial [Planctomycetes bacterium]|nr:hypothetical protein [Planctomycetota bacterium]
MNGRRMVRRDNGLTMLEVLIGITLLTSGMVVLLSSLGTATSQSQGAIARVFSGTSQVTAVPRIIAILNDSSIAHIDSSSRFKSSFGNFETDRFAFTALRQCPSATCRFHTRQDLSVIGDHLICGSEYRAGFGLGPVTRGKNWPADLDTCPLDGSPLMQFGTLDGIKLLTARSDGNFATIDGRPHWNTMQFLFPRPASDGLCELALYELRTSDLVAAGPLPLNWTRWTNASVSFVDLLDFGSDGTTDGNPDGSAPVSLAESDADMEQFSLLTDQDGQTAVYFRKLVGSATTAPYRQLEIIVNLETGRIDFDIEHRDTLTSNWRVVGSVT